MFEKNTEIVDAEIVTAEETAPTYIGEADFATRNAELKSLAEATGLRLPKTRLPEGHALWEIGDEHKRQLAQNVSDMPDLATALVGLNARITAERPQDFTSVPVQQIRMDPRTGGLYRQGKNGTPFGYTENGFQHVAQFMKPAHLRSFAENMLALPNELRAQVFNFHAQKALRDESVTLRTILEPSSGKRVVRAVTSKRHSLTTGDDSAIMAHLAPGGNLPTHLKGAKARITRELDRSEFELIWPAMDRQLVVGDIALMGVRITNSETKAGSLRVEAFLLRVLCANFTTAETDDINADEISLRHIGDLGRRLSEAFARAQTRVLPFVQRFSDAYKLALPKSRGEVLSQVGKAFTLPAPALELAGKLWDADGERTAGDTLAGLANALTRASQEQPTAIASDIERAAGKLIAQGFKAAGI
jgi:hypothetical protein